MTVSDFTKDLTQRAKLTFASRFLGHAAQMAAGLLFTPIIVLGLGKELYGAWGMIAGMLGFLGLADLNAGSILRLALGVRQHKPDIEEKQRLIGAAVWQWVIFLPLLLLAGGLLVFFTPRLVPVSQENLTIVYWTMALMVASIPLAQISSIPGSVLAGQNLEYKAMGLNAAMVLIGGAMNALGIMAGLGLVMLAVTSLIGIAMVNGVRLLIARRNLPWFRVKRPRKTELLHIIKLSIPGSMGAAKGALLNSSDVLLFGYCFGTPAASVYMITRTLIRYLVYPLEEILRSGNAGIIHLGGKGAWNRLASLRLELHQMALWGFGVIAAVALFCNHLFVNLWVGESFYGGMWLDLAIIIHLSFRQMAQMDGILLDATLHLYPKETLGIAWSSLGLLIGWSLTGHYGPAAIPMGVGIGQIGLWASYQFLLRRYTGLPIGQHWRNMLRPLMVFALAASGWTLIRFYQPFNASTWWELALSGGMVALLTGIACSILGLTAPIRRSLWRRLTPSQILQRSRVAAG